MLSGATVESQPLDVMLRERFHMFSGFHAEQRDIIERLLQGQRVLAIQRTGWGKSLCYQMASLYYPYLTIVFSPLKALMRDQRQHCNDIYGIPAAIVSSEFSQEQNRETLAKAIAGEFKILFIAPERLSNADWQTAAQHLRISMVVIDEAHCISTWGHDFRPDYRRIKRLLAALPTHTPVLALTATANQRVEYDIQQQTGTAHVIRGTMQRPNLYLHVVHLSGDEEKLSYLGEILQYVPGTGIIYTATQSSAAIVATFLSRQGINAEYYHADREEGKKHDIEQRLMANQYKVVCSTNALGMGIDKPDISFVIHYHIPASPIHYYQEIGRAGRDGNSARCVLLYDSEDLAIQEHFITSGRPGKKHYEAVLSLLRLHPEGLQKRSLALETGIADTDLKNIVTQLEEQRFILYDARTLTYHITNQTKRLDLSHNEAVQEQKRQELDAMTDYALHDGCYMQYLTAYLGDEQEYPCGVCGHCESRQFPVIIPSERIQSAAIRFVHEDFMPYIERYCIEQNEEGLIQFGNALRASSAQPDCKEVHKAGWSLSLHGRSRVGKQVRASKYEDAGPFALGLVMRAVEVCQARYPLHLINGVVSVPPSKNGALVEMFARQVAEYLGIAYLDAVGKIRQTREQKYCTNRAQKEENLRDAFCIRQPAPIADSSLLLIDDIYDSGATIREVSKVLMLAGASAVYPLTITRTLHSDNQ